MMTNNILPMYRVQRAKKDGGNLQRFWKKWKRAIFIVSIVLFITLYFMLIPKNGDMNDEVHRDPQEQILQQIYNQPGEEIKDILLRGGRRDDSHNHNNNNQGGNEEHEYWQQQQQQQQQQKEELGHMERDEIPGRDDADADADADQLEQQQQQQHETDNNNDNEVHETKQQYNPFEGKTGDEEVVTAFDPKNEERRRKVVEMFKHAWAGYEKWAWGYDELNPVARTSKNWVSGGIGMTIIDALDTMWLMGLMDSFNAAKEWIRNSLDFNKHHDISVFETTIRILGGLISAYDFSGDKVFIDKAVDIADRLMYAFNTPTGIPFTTINLATHQGSNPSWNGRKSVLAEFGTLQLEFRRLSQITGNPMYDEKVTKVMDIIQDKADQDGLFPIYFDEARGRPVPGRITLGAMGDSFYEYLLKQWLLTGKTEQRYRTMYDNAMAGIMRKMIKKTPTGLTYIAELENNGRTINKMDHLACFTAGMLALGAQGETKVEHMRVAEELTATCHEMYARSPTGISPEVVHFDQDLRLGSPNYYILRPETVESYFYLYRLTRDEKYRDWGWEMVEAIEKYCKVEGGGYAGLRDVMQVPPTKDDTMQTFFLAETLKYLYLLFSPDDVLSLDEFVFNTEAHPIRITPRQ